VQCGDANPGYLAWGRSFLRVPRKSVPGAAHNHQDAG
jgi:hypothetical protein